APATCDAGTTDGGDGVGGHSRDRGGEHDSERAGTRDHPLQPVRASLAVRGHARCCVGTPPYAENRGAAAFRRRCNTTLPIDHIVLIFKAELFFAAHRDRGLLYSSYHKPESRASNLRRDDETATERYNIAIA